MELTRENVMRIADLARLKLTDDELARYQNELGRILKAFEDLAQIPIPKDLEGDARSAILFHQAERAGQDASRTRPDVVENTLPTKTFLGCAPDKEGVFVRVPAILERST